MTETTWAPPSTSPPPPPINSNAHDVAVQAHSDGYWYATCQTCGWASRPCSLENEAMVDAGRHHQSVEEPKASPSMPAFGFTPQLALIVGGLAAMAAGLLLPWVTMVAPFVGRISITGFDTDDGKFLAVGVAVLAVLGFVHLRGGGPEAVRWLLVAGGAAALLVIGADYVDATERVASIETDDFPGLVNIGIGIYLCGAGAGAIALGALAGER